MRVTLTRDRGVVDDQKPNTDHIERIYRLSQHATL